MEEGDQQLHPATDESRTRPSAHRRVSLAGPALRPRLDNNRIAFVAAGTAPTVAAAAAAGAVVYVEALAHASRLHAYGQCRKEMAVANFHVAECSHSSTSTSLRFSQYKTIGC